jgi:Glycosyl transferases group 1
VRRKLPGRVTFARIVIRVLFAGRGGVQSLDDRARGLARHFSADVQADFDFASQGALRVFWSTLRAAIHYDCLWLLSQHPARLLGAWLGRLLFSTPFLVDTGDLLRESVKTAGRSRPYCWVVGAYEAMSVRVPDAMVVRGSRHVALLQGTLMRRRVVLVRDGVECDAFARRDGAATRHNIGAGEGTTVLGIVSTIGFEPRLDLPSPGWDVVECLARLGDLDVMGLVIGDGPGLAMLRELAAQRGVAAKMRWVSRVPLEALPAWLSAIDIFLHTALNNPMSAVRTTGKLPILLAAGCAAVVSEVGEAARVLQGTGLLLHFDGTPGEYAVQLAERVRGLIERHELERWREVGPKLARREFDYAALSATAEELVRDLIARARGKKE